jgi:hypothetical protein
VGSWLHRNHRGGGGGREIHAALGNARRAWASPHAEQAKVGRAHPPRGVGTSPRAATLAELSSSAMAGRGCGCSPGHLNEDNARFLLLAGLILLYLLGGAAVFSALELAQELQAKQRWEERLANFSRGHNLSREELRGFLRHYEEATRAGIRMDSVRPRWDFTGAFYFVGTVVSTIGK